MDSVMSNLMTGFSVALSVEGLVYALLGALLGTVVGVLPGLGPTAAMALLLPATFSMEPVFAIILLSGIWYGSQYGGSTTSILLNMPGEATSVVTAIDGNQMARKGRAGAALFVAAVGSFLAGMIGLLGLVIAAPMLADFAIAFGPPEYFAIAVLGLILLFNLSGGSARKSALMAALGVMAGTVGIDSISASPRFTFGNVHLMDGLEISAVLMGVFGIGEILSNLSDRQRDLGAVIRVRFRDLWPTRDEFRRSVAPMFRGSFLGFFVGLIPGPSGIISTFLSYRLEKRVSKHPEQFGHGAIEGVAGPESANNAVTSASMIPLLSLGLPFTGPAAILLAGFILHGVVPGPMFMSNEPALFWGLMASMVVGNVALLILNLPLVGVFASLMRVPLYYVLPVVLLVILAGAYSVGMSAATLWIAVGTGVFAWIMRMLGFGMAPFVLGLLLGPMLERSLRQSLALFGGDYTRFFTSPISGTMLGCAVLVVIGGILARRLGVRKAAIVGTAPEE